MKRIESLIVKYHQETVGTLALSVDGKVCTFDCLYCECGFNHDFIPHSKRPTREEVASALEDKLKELKDKNITPDALTFSGNGEPTLHPQFTDIIEDTIALRHTDPPPAHL